MADTINFVLAMIDKISAPAKAASASLEALQDQLKSVKSLLEGMPKLEIKVPKLGAIAKSAQEKIGPVFGPGRREQLASAKYQEGLDRERAKAAESLDKQRQRALYAEFQRQERLKAASQATAVVQTRLAPQLGASGAAEFAGTLKQIAEIGGGHGLLNLAATLSAPIRAAGGLKSAISGLGAKFEEVTGLSPGLAAGFAGVAGAAVLAAAGVVKLATAVGQWTIEGANLALEAAEAKQDTLDLFEAMLGSAEAAERTLVAIRDITRATSASQTAVQESASALSAAGVKNEKLLLGAVKAVAQVDSVLKGRGEKIQAAFERAAQTGKFEVNAKRLAGTGVQLQTLYAELSRRTGIGVKQIEAQMKAGKIKAETGIAALTAVIDQKFGPVAEKQAKDLGPQLQRFKDNVSRLFEDVKTGPFLDALDHIIALFDKSTPAGLALHDVLTGIFDGLFAAVRVAEPYVTTFLKGLIIIGLQVAIAFKPLAQQLGITFGGEQQDRAKGLAKTMSLVGIAARYVASAISSVVVWVMKLGENQTALTVLGYVFKGIAIVMGVAAVAAGLVVVGILALLSPLYLVIEAASALIGYIPKLVSGLLDVGKGAVKVGSAIVSGLVEGIKGAAGWLYDAVSDLASGALEKFQSFFEIHSPSRVMARMGVNLTAGLAQGMTAGAHTASAAMIGAGAQLSTRTAAGAHAGLAAPQVSLSNLIGQRYLTGNDNSRPAPYAEPPRIAPRAEARGGRTVIFHPGAFGPGSIVVEIPGANLTAAQIQEMFPNMMADAFELVALSNGTEG